MADPPNSKYRHTAIEYLVRFWHVQMRTPHYESACGFEYGMSRPRAVVTNENSIPECVMRYILPRWGAEENNFTTRSIGKAHVFSRLSASAAKLNSSLQSLNRARPAT